MPLVSVIIPNYNHAPYLVQRIETVLNQTFADMEVIIMDDKSTDDSLAVIEAYRDHPQVSQVLINEANGGSTFKQWNRGIRQAKGEYIWIAESDDYADPLFVEVLYKQLVQHPSAGIAYCESMVVDREGKQLFPVSSISKIPEKERWQRNFFSEGRTECTQYMLLENVIPNASAALFRKNVYEQAGDADERMRLAGDWLQWAKMLLKADLVFVAQPLNYYRSHPATVRFRTSTAARTLEIQECSRIITLIGQNADVPGERIAKSYNTLFANWLKRIQQENYFKKEYYRELLQLLVSTGAPPESRAEIAGKLTEIWLKHFRKTALRDNLGIFYDASRTDKQLIRRILGRINRSLSHRWAGREANGVSK